MECIKSVRDCLIVRVLQSGKQFPENILSSDVMTAITNQLNGFLSVINKITDKLGSLGSIGVGAGLFAGWKESRSAGWLWQS